MNKASRCTRCLCLIITILIIVISVGTSTFAHDVNGDLREGLAEAIHSLQVTAGVIPALSICASGLTACSGQCVDTQNNPQFCGGCSTSCDTESFCYQGECLGLGGKLPGEVCATHDDCFRSVCADLEGGSNLTCTDPTQLQNVRIEKGLNRLILAWDEVDWADSYNIYTASEPLADISQYSSLANGTLHTDQTSPSVLAGYNNGTIYYAKVVAVKNALEMGESLEVSVLLDCATGECICQNSEVVGYPGNGNTCDLNGHPNSLILPKLALSQYRYNEFFSGRGASSYDDFTLGPAEGRACGACLEITGPNGTLVFIVNEIADINAVANNGRSNNVHLESAYIDLVRDGSGLGYDVVIRPVPCPTTTTIQVKANMWNHLQPWYWTAVYYTFYQIKEPLKSVEIKAEEGHDQWYPLEPTWTNQWKMENYDSSTTSVYIPLPDPVNGPIRFRLTSIYGDVVITNPIQQVTRPAASQIAYYDSGVQFSDREYISGACTDNTITSLCGTKGGMYSWDPPPQCDIENGADPVSCSSVDSSFTSGQAYCTDYCRYDTSECQ